MPGRTREVDAVVVGAGTAGANAAYQLALQGRQVVLVERRALDQGGAQWHNGVLDWQFTRAGLAPPVPPERVTEGGAVHLCTSEGEPGVTVARSPVASADMARLGTRLRALARDAGVDMLERASGLSVEERGGRIVALDLRATPVGEGGTAAPLRLVAPLFVDASGRQGVLRRTSPSLARWCPPVPPSDLCSASDAYLRVADAEGAKRFLHRFGAEAGDAVTAVGVNGGFSTRAIRVSAGYEHVSVLVGCLARGQDGAAPAMLAAARAAAPWIGEPIQVGTGVIPLRRPYARFTAPGLALVGDAACQVFPAHGSGIGMGLMAGRILAEAVAGAGDPGDEEVLWGYQARFQREVGGTLAAYDALRRMSSALGGDGVGAMVRAGLVTEPMTYSGLDQRWGSVPVGLLPRLAARLARHPRLAAAMLPRLAGAQLVVGMGRRYPDGVDEEALARWDRRVQRLVTVGDGNR